MSSKLVFSWCFFLVMSVFVILLNGKLGFVASEDQNKVYIIYLGEITHNDPEIVTALHLNMLETLLGSEREARQSIVHSYRYGFSGFAAHLTHSQARKISEHPDVVQVTRNHYYEVQTTRTFDYLGLSQTNPHGLLLEAKMGEDIIIGIIDSGVWPESESFNDRGFGPIPERWKGKCVDGQQFDANKHCNRKLIGARYYSMSRGISETDYMSAREGLPHGTHVASTAGGSFVSNVSDSGFGIGTVRGGAPSARIAVYKVCWESEDGQCAFGDILKAMDDAINDGVDVMSISLGRSIPILTETEDIFSYGAFHAISKGIPVLCAGGNDGPGDYTVANIAPWIITVAATTLDRWFPTPLTLGNNVTLWARTPFKGEDIRAELMFVESVNEITSTARGKVVLAFATESDRLDLDLARKWHGFGLQAVIIAFKREDVLSVGQLSPANIYIDYEKGAIIMKYIVSTSSPTIKISSAITLTGAVVATKVAEFSGRGPNSISPYVLKPDIAAPGVSILAASSPFKPGAEQGFIMESGTSMSTPVVAGLVALLRAVHPDWSPAAIRSALVTTASTTDPYGEPIFADGSSKKLADPFDFGGGLVNPSKAADPGLVYDATPEDYLNFLCASGYDDASIGKIGNRTIKCPTPRPSVLDLNLPSITIPYLQEVVTLTRTVTNVGPVDSVYKLSVVPPYGININVTPNALVFNSSVKQISFSVTVTTTHKANSAYYFGSLTWNGFFHGVTIPISVRTQKLIYFDI